MVQDTEQASDSESELQGLGLDSATTQQSGKASCFGGWKTQGRPWGLHLRLSYPHTSCAALSLRLLGYKLRFGVLLDDCEGPSCSKSWHLHAIPADVRADGPGPITAEGAELRMSLDFDKAV